MSGWSWSIPVSVNVIFSPEPSRPKEEFLSSGIPTIAPATAFVNRISCAFSAQIIRPSLAIDSRLGYPLTSHKCNPHHASSAPIETKSTAKSSSEEAFKSGAGINEMKSVVLSTDSETLQPGIIAPAHLTDSSL